MLFFFFNESATNHIHTLSLHDALPISGLHAETALEGRGAAGVLTTRHGGAIGREEHAGCLDRKSTRLNSSHLVISYAVFSSKKKIMAKDADDKPRYSLTCKQYAYNING